MEAPGDLVGADDDRDDALGEEAGARGVGNCTMNEWDKARAGWSARFRSTPSGKVEEGQETTTTTHMPINLDGLFTICRPLRALLSTPAEALAHLPLPPPETGPPLASRPRLLPLPAPEMLAGASGDLLVIPVGERSEGTRQLDVLHQVCIHIYIHIYMYMYSACGEGGGPGVDRQAGRCDVVMQADRQANLVGKAHEFIFIHQ